MTGTSRCRMCGRRLRDAASRARGTGPVCHAKTRAPHPPAHAASATQLAITTTEEQPR
ncbi:DUF6011 domain-containing protein [Streptomyces scopuliridis]|uniref:DUF6011 domain-containing protein n=1 Tax=Streptomyces scopuliridis TaxID=452529 RepID=UPI003673B3CF